MLLFQHQKIKRIPIKEILKSEKKEIYKINDLYTKISLEKPVIIKDAVVIYKTKIGAIIKQTNNRAIYLYKNTNDLKLGYKYTLKINEIINYHGLKEVSSFSILKEYDIVKNYKKLFIDAKENDILNPKNQNEIAFNLKGIVKKGKLVIDEANSILKGKTIKIYAKNKQDLPKENKTITFNSVHIGVYRGVPQVLIHSNLDYKVEN